jgi:hypothetical protein
MTKLPQGGTTAPNTDARACCSLLASLTKDTFKQAEPLLHHHPHSYALPPPCSHSRFTLTWLILALSPSSSHPIPLPLRSPLPQASTSPYKEVPAGALFPHSTPVLPSLPLSPSAVNLVPLLPALDASPSFTKEYQCPLDVSEADFEC